MGNNVLKDFADYVEYFCRIHTKIMHRDDRKHFVRLDNQELQQSINANLYYPVVTLEKLTAGYSDVADSPQKTRHIEMLFLDSVSDAGNPKEIENVQSRMENIAESFIFKTQKMRRNSKFETLRNLKMSNIELDYVSNIATLLWGVLLSFDVEIPISNCIDENDFME